MLQQKLSDSLRAAARYVYAVNQSPVKVVLDPIYEGVAATLLRGTDQPSAELMKKTFPENLFFEYRERSRKLQYFIEDFDFSQARPDLLTPRQRRMMHTVTLGETSGAAVADGFLRAFRTMPEVAAFFGVWFVEELNHFLGYHNYLQQMGEGWPEERGMNVAKVDFRPYSDDPMEIAACNMYQELLGYLVYRSFGKQVRDPFLANLLQRFAKDELRHYKFYQDVVARHLQKNPDFRKIVLKVFFKATSPFNQVSGSYANVIEHLKNGIYYFRKPEFDYFMGQLEFLVGKDMSAVFEWFFRSHIAPCGLCHQDVHLCACEDFEHRELEAVPGQQSAPRSQPVAVPSAVA
jgi:hypothetical protein